MKNYHNCAVSSCGLIITSDLPMCKAHWAMVPENIQKRLNKHWKQGGGARYLMARAEAVKAVQQQLGRASVPASPTNVPSSHSDSQLKTSLNSQLPKVLLLFLVLTLGIGPGCMVIGYKNPDGSKFIAITCIADDKIAKLAVDHTTKATSTGLAIGAIDHQVDDEAFKAAVSGAVEGTLKALGFVL